jgi:Polyketide cyclase / dehydrase and lipid transport
MATNEYHFITHWRVQGVLPEVIDIISDAEDLVRWWPSVYLDVKVLAKGDENGLGKVVDLYTKGWLPYTLRWQFRVTDVRNDGFTLVAQGDFEGRGIWTLQQNGPWVDVTYDWKISAEKPLLRYFSFLMKPIFAANHHWAMARGEESLQLELERRHAKTTLARAQILPPPQPTTSSPLPILLGAIAAITTIGALAYYIFVKARSSYR